MKWWWPFSHSGEGSASWYFCPATLAGRSCQHECKHERDHGYKHVCRDCRFRWAS